MMNAGRIEKTVFISYRRNNFPWALAIFQDLTSHGFDVFLDYTGIASGDFEQVILENIGARAHFLVLLTPSALERCGDPKDWLRREIEAALDTQRNMIPVMLEGFDFGTPAIARQLTGKLATLKHYNALSIPEAYFGEAMDRLRSKYLQVPLAAVLHPASPSAQRVASEQRAAADTAPAVLKDALTAQALVERKLSSLAVGQAAPAADPETSEGRANSLNRILLGFKERSDAVITSKYACIELVDAWNRLNGSRMMINPLSARERFPEFFGTPRSVAEFWRFAESYAAKYGDEERFEGMPSMQKAAQKRRGIWDQLFGTKHRQMQQEHLLEVLENQNRLISARS